MTPFGCIRSSLACSNPPSSKAAPATKLPVVPALDFSDYGKFLAKSQSSRSCVQSQLQPDRRRIGSLSKRGAIEERKNEKAARARLSANALDTPPEPGDSCPRVRGRLDSSRVSHLSIDDQSIRSKGKPLRPIERLAGSGHCAETPRPRSPAAAPDEGRRCGMRVMTKAIPSPALVERERAAMIDELCEGETPKIAAC